MKLVRTKDAFNIFKLLYLLIIFTSLVVLKTATDYSVGYIIKTEIDIKYMLESLFYSVFLLSGGVFLFYKFT